MRWCDTDWSVKHVISSLVNCAPGSVKEFGAEAEKEIAELDAQYPEYAAQVLPTFKKSLEDVGIKDTPLLKYMQ